MSDYLVIIEQADGNYAAYSPDLPGCVASADTREETLLRVREAIELHLEGLRADGLPIPPGSSSAEWLAV